MATFKATYRNAFGQDRIKVVQASDAVSAKRSLRRQGFLVTQIDREIKPAANARDKRKQQQPVGKKFLQASFLERTPGISERAVFANKLAALVDAGVPIVRSIDLMAPQQKTPMFRRALSAVGEDVREGQTLAEAMRRWPKVFDRLMVPMVDAGEAGGVLDATLRRLAKLLEDTAKLQNQLRSAMIYPVAVLIIAILVFLGLTIFFIPIFAGLYETLGNGAELPFLTRIMVDLSELLRSPFSLVLLAVLAGGLWLFGIFYSSPSGRRVVDRFILKLPLFGELVLKSSVAQFCRTFSALNGAGVPILSSLEIVKDTTTNSIISDCIKESREDVLQGVPLSIALERKKVFPTMALAMLSIGEETGEVDKMLTKTGDFYEDEVATLVKGLSSLLEPLMIIVVGGIVGVILVAMYLPMFTIFQYIK